MEYEEHYDYIEVQEGIGENEPKASIQWKGTDVCMDFHCLACNYHSHFDSYFVYYIRCHGCGQLYAMAHHVQVIPLPSEHANYVLDNQMNLIHEDHH